MKILYKFFIFALILRMIPIVLASMHIFPNTIFDTLGFQLTSYDPLSIFVNIVSPIPLDTHVPGVGTIQLTISAVILAIIGVSILQAIRVNAFGALIVSLTGFFIFPFILSVGLMIYTSVGTYNSDSTNMLILTLLVGLVALAFITLIEYVTHGDVSE